MKKTEILCSLAGVCLFFDLEGMKSRIAESITEFSPIITAENNRNKREAKELISECRKNAKLINSLYKRYGLGIITEYLDERESNRLYDKLYLFESKLESKNFSSKDFYDLQRDAEKLTGNSSTLLRSTVGTLIDLGIGDSVATDYPQLASLISDIEQRKEMIRNIVELRNNGLDYAEIFKRVGYNGKKK